MLYVPGEVCGCDRISHNSLFIPSLTICCCYKPTLVPAMAVAHEKCQKEIVNVFVTQYYIWPITNWCNFAYVPENLRVLVSNIISVFWNAYLCSRLAK